MGAGARLLLLLAGAALLAAAPAGARRRPPKPRPSIDWAPVDPSAALKARVQRSLLVVFKQTASDAQIETAKRRLMTGSLQATAVGETLNIGDGAFRAAAVESGVLGVESAAGARAAALMRVLAQGAAAAGAAVSGGGYLGPPISSMYATDAVGGSVGAPDATNSTDTSAGGGGGGGGTDPGGGGGGGGTDPGSIDSEAQDLLDAIDFAEPNGIASIAQSSAGIQRNPPSWGLDRVDQATAKLNNEYDYYPSAGAGSTVYVIDTGINTQHPDFGGRATWGVDLTTDGVTTDNHGHGTHVAGTVAGTSFGIAKAASLVAVKVLDSQGNGGYDQIIAGINWAVRNCATSVRTRRCVLNLSLGGDYSSAVNVAVTAAITAGYIVSVAAGNNNMDACNYSPSSASQALSVMSTDSTDKLAATSNYGVCTDIAAPGVSITSDLNTGGSATMSGTSMATAHVSGAAALLWSQFPVATGAQVAAAIMNKATLNVVTAVSANQKKSVTNKKTPLKLLATRITAP